MTLTCPRCASSEVRKLSLIHSEGLSIAGVGAQGEIAAVAHRWAAGGGPAPRASVRQRTLLNRQVAPPKRKTWLIWAISAAVFGALALAALPSPDELAMIEFGAAVLSVYFAVDWRRFNEKELPALRERWKKSCMCGRCGEVFVPR